MNWLFKSISFTNSSLDTEFSCSAVPLVLHKEFLVVDPKSIIGKKKTQTLLFSLLVFLGLGYNCCELDDRPVFSDTSK